MLFQDRTDAGRQLAAKLRGHGHRNSTLVLALPRGGVPVGYEVARMLHAPLDVFLVRKIGVPGQHELAMGAVASGGILVVNQDVLQLLHLPESAVADAAVYARQELDQQEEIYRGSRPRAPIANRHVILVDDGLATGSTMRAAVRGVKTAGPQKITIAVPVGSKTTCRELVPEADEVLCVHSPDPFSSVGEWYQDFGQTPEDEVRELLKRADAEHSGPGVSD